MKAKEIIALLSQVDPETEIRALYETPNRYCTGEIYELKKCAVKEYYGKETVEIVFGVGGLPSTLIGLGETFPIDTPDEEVMAYNKEEDEDDYDE